MSIVSKGSGVVLLSKASALPLKSLKDIRGAFTVLIIPKLLLVTGPVALGVGLSYSRNEPRFADLNVVAAKGLPPPVFPSKFWLVLKP